MQQACDEKTITGKKYRPYGQKILYTTSFAKQFSLSLSLSLSLSSVLNTSIIIRDYTCEKKVIDESFFLRP